MGNRVVGLFLVFVGLFLSGFIPQKDAESLMKERSLINKGINQETLVQNPDGYIRRGRYVYKVSTATFKNRKSPSGIQEDLKKHSPRATNKHYTIEFMMAHREDLKIMLGIVILLGVMWLIFFLNKKIGKKGWKGKGTTLLELMFAMAIFVVAISAIVSLYVSVRPLMNELDAKIDEMNSARNIKWFYLRMLSPVCEDASHSITFANSMTRLDFYTCDFDAGTVQFNGPFSIYKDGSNIVFFGNGQNKVIAGDISALQFARYGDKIIMQYNMTSGANYTLQVAIRTDEI